MHHRDGVRSNNRLDNLQYVNASENQAFFFANQPRRQPQITRGTRVKWRPFGTSGWNMCSSIKAAAEEIGIDPGTVSRCCHQMSISKGYEIRFQDTISTNFPGEEWRQMIDPASGAMVPGRMVSSCGRITSSNGQAFRGYRSRLGYYVTQISGQKQMVHRVIAMSFIGPSNGLQVNHKDLDKGNNAVENLEYVTVAENHLHFHANAVRKRPSNVKPVWSRPAGSNDRWTWHASMNDAARALAVNCGAISHCVSRNYSHSKAGGYEFCLADVPDAATLPGEEWRTIDLRALQLDREIRTKTTA